MLTTSELSEPGLNLTSLCLKKLSGKMLRCEASRLINGPIVSKHIPLGTDQEIDI